MAWIGFALLFAKRPGVLTETSLSTAISLLGACVALGVVWVVAERLYEWLPAVMHCNVCGARLRRGDLFRNLRASENRTYPFRLMDNTREEQPVRSLCHKCSRRACRLRRELDEGGSPTAEAVALRA